MATSMSLHQFQMMEQLKKQVDGHMNAQYLHYLHEQGITPSQMVWSATSITQKEPTQKEPPRQGLHPKSVCSLCYENIKNKSKETASSEPALTSVLTYEKWKEFGRAKGYTARYSDELRPVASTGSSDKVSFEDHAPIF